MSQSAQQLKQDIEKETGIQLRPNWQEHFYQYINQLINTDLERLVFLLYRIDVKESTIKQLLQQRDSENAGVIIADAIIERQQEKIALRLKYKQPDKDIPEEERW